MTTVRYISWPLCRTYSDHCAVHIVTTGLETLLKLYREYSGIDTSLRHWFTLRPSLMFVLFHPLNSTWLSQKVSGKKFLKFCCVGSTAYCAHRYLWPGGPCALKIRVCIRKNGAAVKTVTTWTAFKHYNPSTFWLIHIFIFLRHFSKLIYCLSNLVLTGTNTNVRTRSVNSIFWVPYLLAYLQASQCHGYSLVSVLGKRACLTLRRLMSYIYICIYIYIYGAPTLDVSRSHTTTQHSR